MRQSEDHTCLQTVATDLMVLDWAGLQHQSATACIRTLIAQGSEWSPDRAPAKKGLCVLK